jgi:hypothetical protein
MFSPRWFTVAAVSDRGGGACAAPGAASNRATVTAGRLGRMAAEGNSLAGMRRAALAAVVACLALAAPAVAAPSLLHVGDSLAIGSDPPLRALLPGWSVTTDALKSQPTAAGVAIIDSSQTLPGSLVVELGTNDSPDQSARFAGYVRHVLALAGPKRCVVWVNVHRPPYNGVSYAGFNRALDQIAGASPNLAVVDWNGMVNAGQAQVAPDGVHPTPDGYRARATAIAQALEGCSSQGSNGTSHTIPARKKRRHHAAAPKPRPRPKPKPATRFKPDRIDVYIPPLKRHVRPTTAARSSSDSGSGLWFGVGALVVLALGAAGYAVLRRRRS